MKKVRREVRGQFVIIAALLIAALTLTLAISIHQVNLNRQTLSYRPVNELLLGITSDMERALSVSLAKYTSELVQGQPESTAIASGQEFMKTWKQSLLSSYASSRLRLNDPPASTLLNYGWVNSSDPSKFSFSQAICTYNIDIDEYGFKGWTGLVAKYVKLQILSVTPDSGKTELTFHLSQSSINDEQLMPIDNLSLNDITAGIYAATLVPSIVESLTYQGNGNYILTFDAGVDSSNLGAYLIVTTPDYGIKVFNYYYISTASDTAVTTTTPPSTEDWSDLYLGRGNPASTVTVSPTPPTHKGHLITGSSNGTSKHTEYMESSLLTPFEIVTAQRINITMCYVPTAKNAIWSITMTLGFKDPSGNNHVIGSVIFEPINTGQLVYTDVINTSPVIIPAGSAITLTSEATLLNKGGSLKLMYDPIDYVSKIDLY